MRITCQFWQRVGLSVLSDATMNTTTMNHWHQGKQHCVFSVCGVILRPFYTSKVQDQEPRRRCCWYRNGLLHLLPGDNHNHDTHWTAVLRMSNKLLFKKFYKKNIWNLASWFTSRKSPHWPMLLRDPAVLMRPLHPGMRDQAVRKVVGCYAISLITDLLQEILL